ncbi:hypothetical protein ES702_05885 [subsurface metagenome]
MALSFLAKIARKLVHTFDIFSIFDRVTPNTYKLFRELVKIAVERLEYSVKKDIYNRMQGFVNSTPNRWDNVFYDMLLTRFPLKEIKIKKGTVKCDCGHTWVTQVQPINFDKIACPECSSKKLFIRL